jgi:hypothetical protein
MQRGAQLLVDVEGLSPESGWPGAGEVPGGIPTPVAGDPDLKHVSTSYVNARI